MRERTYGPREPVAVTWRRDRAPRQERYVFQRRVLVACLVTVAYDSRSRNQRYYDTIRYSCCQCVATGFMCGDLVTLLRVTTFGDARLMSRLYTADTGGDGRPR